MFYLKAMIANSAEMGDGWCDYVLFKSNDSSFCRDGGRWV